jgi:(E)-4-hydroxy-3-methyl-but-2-enyl pyrophosphate reductase
MHVMMARGGGFCWGVKRAVEKARDLSRQTSGKVYTDGPLVHNEHVMENLRREGIEETTDPERLREGSLLIRAHGVTPQRRRTLKALDIPLTDATCPDVARIQGLVRKHARQGYHTLVYGDRGHAEVVGIEGYAEGRCHVITGINDVAALPALQRVCLVSQSTQSPSEYATVAQAVQTRFRDAVVLDTICAATRERQAGLEDVARHAEALVVVGGAHSANTRRLVELAQSLRPTIHIQVAAQLKAADFEGVNTVGLAAGASTPDGVIESVRQRLHAL